MMKLNVFAKPFIPKKQLLTENQNFEDKKLKDNGKVQIYHNVVMEDKNLNDILKGSKMDEGNENIDFDFDNIHFSEEELNEFEDQLIDEIDEEFISQEKKEVCPYFLQGTCIFGSQCKLFHPQSEMLVNNINFIGDMDCLICYDKILARSRKFGLLSNCDHSFCIECIRKWRARYLKNANKLLFRLCPVCRKESYIVIPSSTYIPPGPEKDHIIELYQKHLSNLKCKYFKPGDNDSCPFGNSCFYQHLNPDGTKYIFPKKVKLVNSKGEIEYDKDLKLCDLIRTNK